MVICPSDRCTGCAACAAACARDSIAMTADAWGELHPAIDIGRCAKCGICLQVCPQNSQQRFQSPLECFASWNTNERNRALCASGGVGTAIAEYVIQQKRGVVFGTVYDNKMMPIVTSIETIGEVDRLKGSKYVQSSVRSQSYRRLKELLEQGRFVAFIGTPCQIAGVRGYLRHDYQNLLLVDLICHGVSPASYLQEEVKKIKAKKRIKGIVDIRFRGNDGLSFNARKDCVNYCFSLWCENSAGERKLIYSKPWDENIYFAGFLLGATLRENCYSCSYARPERISDITIGDFIGLGTASKFPENVRNVSSVMTNTERGSSFWADICRTNSSIRNVRREYSERLKYKPSLVEPFKRHELNVPFRALVPKVGYCEASEKTIGRYIRHRKIKKVVKKLMPGYSTAGRIMRKFFVLLKGER